jgi:hypothetical protein
MCHGIVEEKFYNQKIYSLVHNECPFLEFTHCAGTHLIHNGTKTEISKEQILTGRGSSSSS